MREFEAHFLNIDPQDISARLEKLGAEKISDVLLKETIFDSAGRTWNKIHKLVRLRTDGKHSTVAYKEQIEADKMGGREEIETEITNYDNTAEILENIGLTAVRWQEKKRTTFRLGDVVYDIDQWPKIPAYIEIESDNEEKVRQASEALGFKWDDACLFDAKKILIDIYGLKNFDNVKYFTFDKFEYHD